MSSVFHPKYRQGLGARCLGAICKLGIVQCLVGLIRNCRMDIETNGEILYGRNFLTAGFGILPGHISLSI